MAELTIKLIQKMAGRWYEGDIAAARAERDSFKRQMRRWFGREQADKVAKGVRIATDPDATGPMPYICPVAERAFVKLVALELALKEIECRVDALATFYDPSTADAVLPTLGLSWWADVRSLIQPPGHYGQMPIKNVKRFLQMVIDADQCFPTRRQIEERDGTVDRENDMEQWHDRFRRKRRQLIDFLDRAVRLGEGIDCEL